MNRQMNKRTRIYIPHYVFGRSLGNLIDQAAGVSLGERDNWIEVQEREGGIFSIVADNMTNEETILGFTAWDEEVEDMDGDSDPAQCFGMSEKLKWKNVILTPEGFYAPSITQVKLALNHVEICAWDPQDI